LALSLKEAQAFLGWPNEWGLPSLCRRACHDRAENITSCIAFLAWIAAATKQIRLGTDHQYGEHPSRRRRRRMAMLDHMLDGRLISE